MPLPSDDFLVDASLRALQELLISSLNRARNLAKCVQTELDAWIEEEATAMVVRREIERREALAKGNAAPPKKMALLERGEEKQRA